MARAYWDLRDAIIWVHDRHDERVNDRAFEPDPLAAILRFELNGTWHNAIRKVLNALREECLAAFRLAKDGGENPILAAFWNNFHAADVNWRDRDIVMRAAAITDLFPAPAPTRLRELPERLPPAAPFVTLSEAVSWIAFQHAMDSDQLWQAVEADPVGMADAEGALIDAVRLLALTANGGEIPFRGKHLNRVGDDERTALTIEIDPIRLNNFARFDILEDGLRHGTGLLLTHGADILERAIPNGLADHYTEVTVERQSLLSCFPAAHAMTVGTPLAVTIGDMTFPGDDFDLRADVPVLPWWSFLQTVAWITTGSVAYVAYVAEPEGAANDPVGTSVAFSVTDNYIARYHCKCPAKDLPADGRWEYCTCTGNAGRSLLDAIKAGTVIPVQTVDDIRSKLTFHDLAGIGQGPTCHDWLAVRPAPDFSSGEVMAAFPGALEDEPNDTNKRTVRRPTISEVLIVEWFAGLNEAQKQLMWIRFCSHFVEKCFRNTIYPDSVFVRQSLKLADHESKGQSQSANK